MGKTRVHLLAKEMGIETKDLIAQLDRLGMRGRKAQSALEDDEVARVRAALAGQERPQVHVGEEKVVADRVVTAEDEKLGEFQARETVVERRVRANVIRRRTSRIEVVPPAGETPQVEAEHRPPESPATEFDQTSAPTLPVEELPEPAPEIETIEEFSPDMEQNFREQATPTEETSVKAAPASAAEPEKLAAQPSAEKPVSFPEEA